MAVKSSIKFWGARGLVSTPNRENTIYGGNTTCMQIMHDDQLIIVDTGFGACHLGEVLMEDALKKQKKLDIHIFYTHFHWDHTQGLPFFHPIYLKNSSLKIYCPLAPEITKGNLDILFDGSYSPFAGIDSMPSSIEFIELKAAVTIENIKVDFSPLDHGRDLTNQIVVPTFSYRFDLPDEQSIVVATDHEGRSSACNDALIEFAENSDIFVHDAQFSDEEYQTHVGWGHSSLSQAVKNIKKSKAKMGILTHHAPGRTDAQIQGLSAALGKKFALSAGHIKFAEENKIYEVKEEGGFKKEKKAS